MFANSSVDVDGETDTAIIVGSRSIAGSYEGNH